MAQTSQALPAGTVPVPSPPSRASSILVQPTGTQTKATIVKPATLPGLAVTFTQQDVTSPPTLFKTIKSIALLLASVARQVGSCPILTGNLIQGVALTASTQKTVAHGLNRAWVGFFALSTHGVAFSGFASPAPSSLFPTTSYIGLTATATGTYDFWVF